MRDTSTQYQVGRFEGAVDEQVRQTFRQHLRSPRPWSIGEKEPDYVPLPDDVADRLYDVDLPDGYGDPYAAAAREEADAE